MKFEVKDEALSVNGLDGYLTIKDVHGCTTVIKEQPMIIFEEFYKLWSVAMKLGGSDDFLNAWTYNQPFRQTVIKALSMVGIKQVEYYTLSQLEALLLSHAGKQGLLFQLHQTFPKLSTQASESKVWMISLKTALKLTALMWQESMHTKSLKVKLLARCGHCLASCAFWLSARMPKQLTIQKPLKVYAKPDGKLMLRILK